MLLIHRAGSAVFKRRLCIPLSPPSPLERKAVCFQLLRSWEQIGIHCFSSSRSRDDSGNNLRSPPRIRSENPFDILGVPKTATYAEIKQRFLKLAMEHHPDQANTATDEKKSNEKFIRFRRAFESLKETMDGGAAQGDNESSWSSDEEFLAWYYEETGKSDSIDLKTRREVIEVVKQSSQSGLDRGGVWEWARRMAEEEAMALDKKHTFKRTVGLKAAAASQDSKSSGDSSNSGSLLRRRRKKPR